MAEGTLEVVDFVVAALGVEALEAGVVALLVSFV
jgi:hypothetical protein